MSHFTSTDYAGDVGVEEAWRLLAEEPRATLVDVRTTAEWNFVGVPDLAAIGKQPLFAEWQSYPTMATRPDFGQALAKALEAGGIGQDDAVLFLCRSGARSLAAARALAGYGFRRSYNIAGGFEGPLDPDGHRGRVAGWKALGLPWRQG